MDDDIDERFKQMPPELQLRVRVADMIGLVLTDEALFLDNCGYEMAELRRLCTKAGAVRRRAA
jgi:hypothetical protein